MYKNKSTFITKFGEQTMTVVSKLTHDCCTDGKNVLMAHCPCSAETEVSMVAPQSSDLQASPVPRREKIRINLF